MHNFIYYLIYFPTYLISLLPLWIQYFFSDLLYYPLYYLIRYRRKVVRKNLVHSFPEKELTEIINIEKEFYSYLCDYFIESIKLVSMSERQIKRRMVFEGLESVNETLKSGKSVIFYMAHNFNWEWVTSLPLHMEDKNVIAGQIYHVLKNKTLDKLFLKLRGRYGATSIPMDFTLRRVIEYRKENKTFILGFISDQVPKWQAINHWLDFLGQDTPVFTGTEKIAKKMDCAVYFCSMYRPRRGKYICKVEPMGSNITDIPDFQLTDMYFEKLEAHIRQYPANWLWTHNRWKRKREEYFERIQKWSAAKKALAAELQKESESSHGDNAN